MWPPSGYPRPARPLPMTKGKCVFTMQICPQRTHGQICIIISFIQKVTNFIENIHWTSSELSNKFKLFWRPFPSIQRANGQTGNGATFSKTSSKINLKLHLVKRTARVNLHINYINGQSDPKWYGREREREPEHYGHGHKNDCSRMPIKRSGRHSSLCGQPGTPSAIGSMHAAVPPGTKQKKVIKGKRAKHSRSLVFY